MTHSEREAELLVRVVRLQRSAERLSNDLDKAGLITTRNAMDIAVRWMERARGNVMSAIGKEDRDV